MDSDSIESNNVWKHVNIPSPDTEVIHIKWVLKVKSNCQDKVCLFAHSLTEELKL